MLTNIRLLDKITPIVILFNQEDAGVISHISEKYDNLEVHSYIDWRDDKSYAPSIRPYLWHQYLSEDKNRENETYFQIDSDIIFREIPKFKELTGKQVVGSDCSSYIHYDYIVGCTHGYAIAQRFAELLNIPLETIKQTPGIGAQWLISNPTAQYWYHVWQDCGILYNYLNSTGSDIQVWTAEMWAQLYNLPKFGYSVEIDPELAFCRSTDPIEKFDEVKILHNAGVTSESDGMFFKGKYVDYTPFTESFEKMNTNRAGYKYIEAIIAASK